MPPKPGPLFTWDASTIKQQLEFLSSRAKVQAVIETATDDLAQLTYMLKSHWNRYVSPIGSLPPELLSLILVQMVPLVLDAIDANTTHESLVSWRGRILLTTICKTWRDVALETPAFWAGFPLRPSYRGLTNMLPRWKKTPRTISIDFWARKDLREWKRIADHHAELLDAETLGQLELSLRGRSQFNTAMNILSSINGSCAPNLCSLSLVCFSGALAVPNDFLVSMTPALQHITLTRCAVDWALVGTSISSGNGIFTNLLSLRLSNLEPRPSCEVLDSILSSSPGLEALEWDRTLPDDFDPTFTWSRSSLRSLRLVGSPLPISKMLFRIVSLPTDVDLSLYFSTGASDIASHNPTLIIPLLRQVIDCFASFIKKNDLHTRNGLNITFTGSINYEVRGLTSHQGSHAQLTLPNIRVQDFWTIEDVVSRLETTFFNQRSDSVLSIGEWRKLSASFCNLETLWLSQSTFVDIAPLLALLYTATSGEPLTSDGGQQVHLPKLRRLVLERVELEVDFQRSEMLTILAGTLTLRSQVGAPIKSVEFLGCPGLSKDEVDDLDGSTPDATSCYFEEVEDDEDDEDEDEGDEDGDEDEEDVNEDSEDEENGMQV